MTPVVANSPTPSLRAKRRSSAGASTSPPSGASTRHNLARQSARPVERDQAGLQRVVDVGLAGEIAGRSGCSASSSWQNQPPWRGVDQPPRREIPEAGDTRSRSARRRRARRGNAPRRSPRRSATTAGRARAGARRIPACSRARRARSSQPCVDRLREQPLGRLRQPVEPLRRRAPRVAAPAASIPARGPACSRTGGTCRSRDSPRRRSSRRGKCSGTRHSAARRAAAQDEVGDALGLGEIVAPRPSPRTPPSAPRSGACWRSGRDSRENGRPVLAEFLGAGAVLGLPEPRVQRLGDVGRAAGRPRDGPRIWRSTPPAARSRGHRRACRARAGRRRRTTRNSRRASASRWRRPQRVHRVVEQVVGAGAAEQHADGGAMGHAAGLVQRPLGLVGDRLRRRRRG